MRLVKVDDDAHLGHPADLTASGAGSRFTVTFSTQGPALRELLVNGDEWDGWQRPERRFVSEAEFGLSPFRRSYSAASPSYTEKACEPGATRSGLDHRGHRTNFREFPLCEVRTPVYISTQTRPRPFDSQSLCATPL